jgi:hypothetical protein
MSSDSDELFMGTESKYNSTPGSSMSEVRKMNT